jgi:hypothetical protein
MQDDSIPRWIPPLGWGGTLIGSGAIGTLVAVVVHLLVPAAVRRTGIEPAAWWFVLGGLVVFTPMLVAALLLLRQESLDGVDIWRARLRFVAMTRVQVIATLRVTVRAALLSAVVALVLARFGHRPDVLTDAHYAMVPLSSGRWWILGVWIPFALLSVMAQEILMRGVLLPRQVAALGARAWIANAAGNVVVFAAFGLAFALVVAPILLVLTRTVQREQNSWVGVVIHALLTGPLFILTAVGVF